MTVTPDGETNVTLSGTFEGLRIRATIDSRAANGSAGVGHGIALAYDVSDPAAVTIEDTGLEDGTAVAAVDAEGTKVDEATADDGAVTFSALPAGQHEIEIRVGTGDTDDSSSETSLPTSTGILSLSQLTASGGIGADGSTTNATPTPTSTADGQTESAPGNREGGQEQMSTDQSGSGGETTAETAGESGVGFTPWTLFAALVSFIGWRVSASPTRAR